MIVAVPFFTATSLGVTFFEVVPLNFTTLELEVYQRIVFVMLFDVERLFSFKEEDVALVVMVRDDLLSTGADITFTLHLNVLYFLPSYFNLTETTARPFFFAVILVLVDFEDAPEMLTMFLSEVLHLIVFLILFDEDTFFNCKVVLVFAVIFNDALLSFGVVAACTGTKLRLVARSVADKQIIIFFDIFILTPS